MEAFPHHPASCVWSTAGERLTALSVAEERRQEQHMEQGDPPPTQRLPHPHTLLTPMPMHMPDLTPSATGRDASASPFIRLIMYNIQDGPYVDYHCVVTKLTHVNG